MKQTLREYAKRIQSGRIDPTVECAGLKRSGLIFDPAKKGVPLNIIAFGLYRLGKQPVKGKTGKREYVFVPQEGRYELRLGQTVFKGERKGGPFAALPGESNASAVYVPEGLEYEIRGSGEMAFFSAPAYGPRTRIPLHIKTNEVECVSRGVGSWRRDIYNLVAAGKQSSNLTVGETYSPPALWSGTPLHVHDKDAEKQGQSDLEEVYYHRARYAEGKWGAYGVQLLFDEKTLNKAYVVKDKTAVAIPGAAHPVVAGPVSDMLYLWGLAGKGKKLMMWDIPEFAYLKRVEGALKEMEGKRGPATLTAEQLSELQARYQLSQRAATNLLLILREAGYELKL